MIDQNMRTKISNLNKILRGCNSPFQIPRSSIFDPKLSTDDCATLLVGRLLDSDLLKIMNFVTLINFHFSSN